MGAGFLLFEKDGGTLARILVRVHNTTNINLLPVVGRGF